MRAREPDTSGFVTRDGVRIGYEVFGSGSPTVLLMPTWSIVPSRVWKAQVPYLARHFRVVTFDGRGAGRSDRPVGVDAYLDDEFVADALAVLEATDTATAIVVGFSRGVGWALRLASQHPGRVLALVAISSALGLVPERAEREQRSFFAPADPTAADSWALYNRQGWLEGGYDDFLRFFFDQMFPEPHSTKPWEDCVGWAREVPAERLAETEAAQLRGRVAGVAPGLLAVNLPVLVIHGDGDRIRPHADGIALAEAIGGSLVTVAGGGHGLQVRDPVFVNRALKDFVDRVVPTATTRTWVRAARRPKRALYLSSAIGLGHARRDVAIVEALRKHHPDLQVDWLAQHPVTAMLAEVGEQVHPASVHLSNESAHIEDEAAEHDLHAFQAIRRMDEILVNNFLVFDDVVRAQHYDLVVGDEAWDVDYFLHENPELKRFSYAWLTDFVGWLPMPAGGPDEAALAADYNAEMLEQRARYRRLRDRSIFVGNPDDVVPASFGDGLPGIRDWTEQNFDFSGYVSGFDVLTKGEREQVRDDLGYGTETRLCVVTVGGSGVGEALLRRVLDAVPRIRAAVPELSFLVVAGPRIDPAALPLHEGVQVRGYLPGLHRVLGAADIAVVQGGLTTCMELTAQRVPFVAVPLQSHFEQQFHVRHRLQQYGAGRTLDYAEAVDPDRLAEAVVAALQQPTASWRPVETDGAVRAAALLADLL